MTRLYHIHQNRMRLVSILFLLINIHLRKEKSLTQKYYGLDHSMKFIILKWQLRFYIF